MAEGQRVEGGPKAPPSPPVQQGHMKSVLAHVGAGTGKGGGKGRGWQPQTKLQAHLNPSHVKVTGAGGARGGATVVRGGPPHASSAGRAGGSRGGGGKGKGRETKGVGVGGGAAPLAPQNGEDTGGNGVEGEAAASVRGA